MRIRNIFFLLLTCCFCLLAFRKQKQQSFSIRGEAQGTSYSILYHAADQRVQKAEVDSILRVIDQSMSLYDTSSLISQWNRSRKGGPIDPHFHKVVEKAFDINIKTDGLFDITVGPLLHAWGFMDKGGRDLPDSLSIARILPYIGMQNLTLREKRLIKRHAEVRIDLNGIAQGYTVDILAGHLKRKGINSFLVELGGELRVEGKKSNGDDYTVGIERPRNDRDAETQISYQVGIRGKALTTSGSYQNYILRGAERLSHIMDPRTGRPIESDIVSVTVLAPDAITADGYDNALMAMGLENAISFVESFSDLEAYFVYRTPEGELADTMTYGFRQIIKNTH